MIPACTCGVGLGARAPHARECEALRYKIAHLLDWVDGLPVERITALAFMKLPEYSASTPTGVIIGKRWRRLDGAHDADFTRLGGKPRWIICEYVPAPDDPKTATVKCTKPVVIVR